VGRRHLVSTLTGPEQDFKAGRMTTAEATRAVHHSFLRLLGLDGAQPGADGLHH
jgi:hypothetical protein